MVLRIFVRAITWALHAHHPEAVRAKSAKLRHSEVAFTHRFDYSVKEQVHVHLCMVGGVLEELVDPAAPICMAPGISAQVRLIKHKLQQGVSVPEPEEGAGG